VIGRAVLAATLVVATTVGVARAGGVEPAERAEVTVRVGDTIRVEGAAIGCQVVRRANRVVLDCRRGGELKGTYGMLFDERRAIVARFRSPRTAKVVFTARHGGSARACPSARYAC
jgi:hypothetical protein